MKILHKEIGLTRRHQSICPTHRPASRQGNPSHHPGAGIRTLGETSSGIAAKVAPERAWDIPWLGTAWSHRGTASAVSQTTRRFAQRAEREVGHGRTHHWPGPKVPGKSLGNASTSDTSLTSGLDNR